MKLINTKYFNLRFFLFGFVMIIFYNLVIKGCLDKDSLVEKPEELVQNDNYKFGYNLNNYKVVNDTVRSGDSFGVLLERNHLFYPQIHHIAEKT